MGINRKKQFTEQWGNYAHFPPEEPAMLVKNELALA